MLAARDSAPGANSALSQLFREYWYPFFGHLRALGHSRPEAEDLVQAFLLHVMEKQTIGRVDRFKGSFRGFLLGPYDFFWPTNANWQRHTSAVAKSGSFRSTSIWRKPKCNTIATPIQRSMSNGISICAGRA